MAETASVEFDHSRELAMLPGSLFEFTSRFLRADQLESVLAIYAFRQAIQSIPHGSYDDAVKWAKLKWWSEEILADPASPARHPVLRALRKSGARAHLDNTILLRLINDAAMQIDATPIGDENAMFDRFSASGSTEIQMELSLENAEINAQNQSFLAAATNLYRMVSSFAPGQRSETEQIPLNIFAKHNISAAQLQQDTHSIELAQIIVELAGVGLNWFSKGLSDLRISSPTSSEDRVCSHIQLRWAMEKRRLEFIQKGAGGFIEAGKRYGPADAWFAWRFLRRLK